MKIDHFKCIVEANFFNLGKPHETNFKEQFSKKRFFFCPHFHTCVWLLHFISSVKHKITKKRGKSIIK